MRFQDVPPEDPQRGREGSRERFLTRSVQAIMSHPDKNRLITELKEKQNQSKKTTSCEQSKQMIHKSGHVEDFRICQLSRRIQYSFPTRDKSYVKIAVCAYDMEGHAKKCVDRYCELAIKNIEQPFKSLPHLSSTINSSKKEDLEKMKDFIKRLLSNRPQVLKFGARRQTTQLDESL